MSFNLNYSSNHESESNSYSFKSDSSSFSSQPSLPSVPTFTSQLHYQQIQQHLGGIYHQCLMTLKGHTSYISSLAISGKFLYTGSLDEEMRAWNRNLLNSASENHIELANNVVAEGKGVVKAMVVLADKLFSAHQDHKIRVWKINSNEHTERPKFTRLGSLPTLGDRASKLLIPKNRVEVRRHRKCTWVHHVDTVSALALSWDETLLYSVSWDKTLKVWRTSDFKCLESIPNAHEDAINSLALSNDGDVYTGSADSKIKVWRKIPGQKSCHFLVATLEKHKSGINALAVSSDGEVLYSGASDRSIIVWENDDGGDNMMGRGTLRGHSKAILCLVVVQDLLCSGSADKTVRVWRRDEGSFFCCLAVLEGHRGPVKCLTGAVGCSNSDENSYVIYSGSLDSDVKVWQIGLPLL